MATVGPATYPSTTLYPGTGVYPGQGSDPLPLILYSTTAVGSSPTWTDATADLRRYDVSRGRETELADIDPGKATIVLDDRDRTYDPDHNSAIRPMNRWWIREQFSGATRDVFVGYAEAYQEEWVAGAEEARTVVSCVDEFKRLTQARLPTTAPPRDTYDDVVLFDEPAAFWPTGDPATTLAFQGKVGPQLVAVNGLGGGTGAGAIVGEANGLNYVTSIIYLTSGALAEGDILVPTGLAEFTIEAWLGISGGLPASTETLLRGPTSAGTWSWVLSMNTSGQLVLEAKNNSGTNHSVTSTTAFANDQTWYHVVGTITGGNLRLYVNGTEENSTAWTGNFNSLDSGGAFTVGNLGGDISSRVRFFNKIGYWRVGLAADRVAAHYSAGRQRGFAHHEEAHSRITGILAAASNTAPRSIRASTRNMTAAYMTGQEPTSLLRDAETADGPDGLLFIAKDGTITFLDSAHRSSSPWNTVQATFDDTNSIWWYQDIGTDYSDALIQNDYTAVAWLQNTLTASDATSIGTFGPRTQHLQLPLTVDSEAQAVIDALVVKYKDPMRRVVRLEKLAYNPDVLDNLLQREIGDRIRIIRHPPGGGSAKDQTAFIQKIVVEQEPGRPLRFVLSVSPL